MYKGKRDILALIGKDESTTIEWKSSLSQINKIIETISGFSNTEGGKIFAGVSNSGKILGIQIGKGTIENITNQISQNTDPKVYPKITTEIIAGKNVLIIDVKESPDHLVLAFGKPYKRVGKSTLIMSKDEYEHLILKKHKERLRFDKQICEGSNLKDIDWDFIKEKFLSLYEKVSKKRIIGSLKSLLESLECVRKGKPTNAGILLFGKEPQKFFMNAYIALARYQGKKVSIERLDYKEFQGNIIKQIDDCDTYIKEHIAIMSRLLTHKVEREDIPEYGWFSIRELTTNAVCHRDYSEQVSKVIIKMFDDHIEYYNPGGLPEGITPQNITKKQYSRNPIIAKILAKIRYIEELGEGWNKIIDEHKTHPLKPKIPRISADKYSMLVTLFSTKEKFEKEKKFKHEKKLSNREIKIIELINKQGSIKSRDVQDMFNVSRDTANRYLNRLIKIKMVNRKGIGKAVYYILK